MASPIILQPSAAVGGPSISTIVVWGGGALAIGGIAWFVFGGEGFLSNIGKGIVNTAGDIAGAGIEVVGDIADTAIKGTADVAGTLVTEGSGLATSIIGAGGGIATTVVQTGTGVFGDIVGGAVGISQTAIGGVLDIFLPKNNSGTRTFLGLF